MGSDLVKRLRALDTEAWRTWRLKFALPDGPLFKEAAE